MSMTVRPAALSDITAIVALEKSVANAPHWSEEQYRTIMLDQRGVLLIAEEDTLAGFCVASFVLGEAELESIVVTPEARRKGIGRALVASLTQWVTDQNGTLIRLEVRASNAGAHSFYAAHGFAERGRRKNYYSNPAEDAVLMELPLAK